MFKKLCLVILAVLFIAVGKTYAISAKPAAKPAKFILKTDSTHINARAFDKAALQRYAADKSFRYTELPEQLSWWTRFWHWLWRVIGNFFDKLHFGKGSWFIFDCILLGIAGGFLVFVILRILGIDVIRIFKRKSQDIQIPYSESLENIHEISFDSEIEQAVVNRNYRLAVRLLYLRCLKQLSDAQLIHWQIEKTNTSYLTELSDTEYRQLFGLLTTQFEYIWYGDFPVNGKSFENINMLFADFKKGLP